MEHFYTYGTKESDFEKIKSDLSELFNVKLQEHESSWWGIYAKGENSIINEIKLYPNYVEDEGLHEEEGDYKYLLDISYPNKPKDNPVSVESSPYNFVLVRHNEL
jgi:hypothetical protein